jgi:two-component system phosphate regulon sensor histidine kinase PhoR
MKPELEIKVVDEGLGIAPEHIPRLTERFYRVDGSRSRESGGTGLGLAIVKHALARHNAHLEIQSHLGRGSTFTIRIPASKLRVNVSRTDTDTAANDTSDKA